MTIKGKRLKVGIVGCGAIGSRIALSIEQDLKNLCKINGIYDIIDEKVTELEKKLSETKIKKRSLKELISVCDLIVEAVDAKNTTTIIRQSIVAKKHVLAMSVGKLLKAQNLLNLANKNNSQILIPSGAIAGIDAIKAACLAPIESITLTTSKPPEGLVNNQHLRNKGINLNKIAKETVIFDGDVTTAVKYFPQNINVAATLAFASNFNKKIRVRILTSPDFKQNSHEIELKGAFGHMVSRTENVVCPDNPKTSYLAVLSGIQTIKQFCLKTKIGT